MGIDPGLLRTGWGLLRVQGSQVSYVDSGYLAPDPSAPLPERLGELYDGIRGLIERLGPSEVAVEKTFVNANPRSSIVLGEARGAILAAIGASGCHYRDYYPNEVKKAVTGSGHADKTQIAAMVKVLLPRVPATKSDVYDALAVAICHAHSAALARRSDVRALSQ